MKRSSMSPMSAKRRAALPERAAVKQAAHERDAWRCQFWSFYDRARLDDHDLPHMHALPLACGGDLECHEIIPRSAWAAGWLVLENCVSICHRHHTWIGDHPADAHAFGLHGFSYERPDVQR